MYKNASYYYPKTLLSEIVKCAALGAISAMVVHAIFSINIMTSICIFTAFIALGLLLFGFKRRPFIIDIDRMNPDNTKLALTDYGFHFENEEGAFRNFYYDDILRLYITEKAIVLLPKKIYRSNWIISNNYIFNSSLDQNQLHYKLGLKNNSTGGSFAAVLDEQIKSPVPIKTVKKIDFTRNIFIVFIFVGDCLLRYFHYHSLY